GPEGFVWGALAGAFAGNFALQWWGARRVGMRWIGGTGWRHPALGEYLKIALPLMIGQSIVVLDETFMSVFGNRVGDGAQTHLQYARRTMLVPVGAIAQAAGVAAYPTLARLFA
ncbi:MAG: murein biosynthesis integral membrane protein MurJ, partial [Actinobacteria bacterium]|nr:murein biosynthesis integral membrane protein MurJ [Actinomycetota bacterium]NIV54744.1 murein biosynthesis integral membrane protein MurJ [Actinomycetota bacterium]